MIPHLWQKRSDVLLWSPHKNPSLWILFGAILVPTIIPIIHINIFSVLWARYTRAIDRRTCSCSCWDTVFKGNYEAGIGGYKHFYFNATPQAAKIWIMTVLFVICCYEAIKHLLQLFSRKELNYRMFILFLSVVYSHYYSFWGYVNYLNDDFYSQWYHQLFFTITELVSTVMVLHLADHNTEVTSTKLLVLIDIAALHVLTGGWDQFVTNVIKQEGQLHQVLRDIFFMLPDMLHIIIPLAELRRLAKSKRTPATHLISNEQFFGSLFLVSALWVVCLTL